MAVKHLLERLAEVDSSVLPWLTSAIAEDPLHVNLFFFFAVWIGCVVELQEVDFIVLAALYVVVNDLFRVKLGSVLIGIQSVRRRIVGRILENLQVLLHFHDGLHVPLIVLLDFTRLVGDALFELVFHELFLFEAESQ